MTELVTMTADELAWRLGWPVSRVRRVGRRAGLGTVSGQKMVFKGRDIDVMEGIANGEIREPREDPKPNYGNAHVYFFQQAAYVKIGWSTKWRKRLIAIQTATPHEMNVLAVYRGGPTMERNLHARFAQHRAKLEWFHFCDEIRDFIADNQPKCVKDAKNSLRTLK